MRGWGKLLLCVGLGLFAAGCPKGGSDYNQGKKAETLKDYDSAVQYYEKALAAEPNNAAYRIKVNQLRFEAGESHIKAGLKLRERGDLQGAAAEFQRAATIDPSSPIAVQELRKTLDMLTEKSRKQDEQANAEESGGEVPLASGPPELKPLSRAPINLKMSNDAKIVFDTIAKLAGLTVVYDPDFPARRISFDVSNVTLEQALDIACLQSKAFWKPVTENIIFVIPDQPQKHRDYDEEVIKTFYLSNTVQPQDLTEISTGLRQVLNLTHVQQMNAQNAIVVRDTPDKVALAERMIKDIDKARPEVVLQVEVLTANMDRLRDLGILPGQSAAITFTPSTATSSSGSSSSGSTGSSSTPAGVPLKGFSCCANYYSVTLPSATANFILTDTATKIIQNPEIRSVDGQPAKLRVGSRVPIATGSFQAGVGVGTTAVNPLVNTQFQYLDVGVNVDVTPRIHPDGEVSLKMKIEVSQVTGTSTIGGLQQPIIGTKSIEHDIRLKDGEVNILGGLFERIDSNTVNGWPGFAQVPFLKYLFSDNKTDHQVNDVLIVVVPHIVRLPDWTRADLRSVYSGSEQNIQVRPESQIRAPAMPKQGPGVQPGTPLPAAPATPSNNTPNAQPNATPENGQGARLRFEPRNVTLKAGQTATLGIVAENVNDLFSIPMLLQYDPKVISVEELQHGGFLSGGNQEIALVQRVDQEHGQAIISATRQPNSAGVSGSGTLIGVVVKALAPGTTNLAIVQINAKDSQQRPIPLVTGEATIQVQP